MDLRKAGFLALLILLGACRPQRSPTIVANAALMPLVPPDTTMLAGFRVEELKKTQVYQTLLKEEKLPQLDEFARETGIDLRKDIWEVIVASDGKSTLTLIHGKFTDGGIADSGKEPDLARKGIRRTPYKGYNLLGDDRVAVVFLNSSVAAAGPVDAVRRVIDARDERNSRPPAGLLDRLREIPSSNQIWAISTGGWAGVLPEELGGAMGGLKRMPVDIRSMVATMDLSSGVRFNGEFVSGDEASARKMNDAIRGVIGVGRLTTPDDKKEMLKFYDAVQVERMEQKVVVRTDIPLEIFKMLLDQFRTPRLG